LSKKSIVLSYMDHLIARSTTAENGVDKLIRAVSKAHNKLGGALFLTSSR
jgi:hypothetical protein